MTLDIGEAVQFNRSKSNKLWVRSQLPAPLDQENFTSDSEAFAYAVAGFQAALGLRVDGKLGPNTFAALRALPRIGEDSDVHDAPDEDEAEGGGGHQPAAPVVVGRAGVSNVLILGEKRVPLPKSATDRGISCSNWQDDDDRHFDSRPRTEKMQHFVLHESVTTSVAATIRALDATRAKKGWRSGIHFTLAPDGHIHQHNDPVTEYLVHASQLNETGGGIEVTNPYNPKFGGASIWNDVIPGPWWCWKPKNGEKVYCKPTPAQMRALVPFVELLLAHCPDLPRKFPTRALGAARPRIEGWKEDAVPGPGVVAHQDFSSHADGRFLLEQLIAELGE